MPCLDSLRSGLLRGGSIALDTAVFRTFGAATTHAQSSLALHPDVSHGGGAAGGGCVLRPDFGAGSYSSCLSALGCSRLSVRCFRPASMLNCRAELRKIPGLKLLSGS